MTATISCETYVIIRFNQTFKLHVNFTCTAVVTPIRLSLMIWKLLLFTHKKIQKELYHFALLICTLFLLLPQKTENLSTPSPVTTSHDTSLYEPDPPKEVAAPKPADKYDTRNLEKLYTPSPIEKTGKR